MRLQKRKQSTETETIVEPLKSIEEIDVIHQRTAFVNRWKSTDSDSEMGSNTSISNRQNIGLVVIVYGSATLVYIQLMLLAAFLQTAATPPGLVFLVSSLGFIGYIVFKVNFFFFVCVEEEEYVLIYCDFLISDVLCQIQTKRRNV